MMAPAFKTASRVCIPGALLCLALMSGSSLSADIYKIIDEDGNVTYSSAPPYSDHAGENIRGEVIQTVSPPSEAGYETARQRQQELRDYLAALDSARLARAELEHRMRASRPITFVQSSTVILPVPTFFPSTRHGPGFSRATGRQSSGIRTGNLSPPRDQWGRTISHRWD